MTARRMARVLPWASAALAACGTTGSESGSSDGGSADGAVQGATDAPGNQTDNDGSFGEPVSDASGDGHGFGTFTVVDASEEPPPYVDPFDGAAGCDGAVNAPLGVCSFTIPLQGGVSALLDGGDCGQGGVGAETTSISFQGTGPDSPIITIAFEFSSALVLGTTGPQPAAAVFLTVFGEDGGQSVWTAPAGSCQIKFDSDACSPLPSSPHRYAISGTGTCSQPATAAGGGSLAPVTIGSFSFVTSVSPPPSDD